MDSMQKQVCLNCVYVRLYAGKPLYCSWYKDYCQNAVRFGGCSGRPKKIVTYAEQPV